MELLNEQNKQSYIVAQLGYCCWAVNLCAGKANSIQAELLCYCTQANTMKTIHIAVRCGTLSRVKLHINIPTKQELSHPGGNWGIGGKSIWF